jgi:NAD(P)-dependent dehydrogenase (short-subunit alcohol dehydrogenase family)
MHGPTKSVVITGASSGIGRASVEEMSRSGWHVFATVRKTADGEKLRKEVGGEVHPVILDVEDRASITQAAEKIKSQLGGRGLDGLVNCAGIGLVRPVEYAGLDDVRRIFEINVFGQIAVTQSLSGLLRKSRGRIVNITSVGVNLALPFGGLLNSSKSAFGMLSDSLRLELHPFGVRVIAIEPGAITTPAVEKTLGDIEDVIRNLPAEGQAQYGEILRKFVRQVYSMEKNGSAPDVVARAVRHALTSNHPRIRYRVGKHAKLLATLPKILPEYAMDAIRLRVFGMRSAGNGRAETKKPASARAVPITQGS